MDGLTSFKNKIFLYGIFVAVIVELVSLPFLGLNMQFSYGLALGTAIAILNFNIMAFTLKRALSGRGISISMLGYIIRLLIYGGTFYISMRVSQLSGLGTVLGFLTLKGAIYYLHGFKAKFSEGRKVSPNLKAEFERMDKEKEEHKSHRLRDRIRAEISYKEDAEFYGETYTKQKRIYQRKKISSWKNIR